MKLCIIHWTDCAMHGNEQHQPDDPVLAVCRMVTVGLLVREDAHAVHVAQDWIEDGQYRTAISIYRRQIDEMTVMDLPEAEHG